MRLYRSTIILAIVLMILVAAHIWLSKPEEGRQAADSAENEEVVLVPVDRTKLSEVERTGAEGKIILTRKENEFILSYPENRSVIETNINDFISSLAQLKSARIISRTPDDYDVYGLTEPQASIKVKTDDGNIIVLHIGDQTYSRENHYVRKDGDNTVYAISWYNAENLLKNLLQTDSGENSS